MKKWGLAPANPYKTLRIRDCQPVPVPIFSQTLTQQREQRTLFRPAPIRSQDDTARLRITPRHYAYLKISEGCDRLCTFCAIPGMRGKHVTKPIEEVMREARELVADGVRELIRGPGYHLLRHGPVRPGTPGRFAARTGSP